MIIILAKDPEITLFFPKNTTFSGKKLQLRLKSLATLDERIYAVEDDGDLRDFITVEFDYELPEGEYEYTLAAEGLSERGLLRVGRPIVTRNTVTKEYDKNVTYIEYNG